MRAHWKHFVYLMKHKWFVLVECVGWESRVVPSMT